MGPPELICSFGSNAPAKAAQDDHAADAKTGDRTQSQGLSKLWTEVEQVVEERRQGKNNTQDVQQRRRSRRFHLTAIAQAELQQDGSQPDRAHHHYGQRAAE